MYIEEKRSWRWFSLIYSELWRDWAKGAEKRKVHLLGFYGDFRRVSWEVGWIEFGSRRSHGSCGLFLCPFGGAFLGVLGAILV
jgi:hypothetical protein